MTATYADLGVSHTKSDVTKATRGLDAGLFPGAFCHVLPDVFGDPKEKYGFVVHADGAGTKSALAYLL